MPEGNHLEITEKPDYRLSQPWRLTCRVLGSLGLLDGAVVEATAAYNLLAGHLAKAEYYGIGGILPGAIAALLLGGSFLRQADERHTEEKYSN